MVLDSFRVERFVKGYELVGLKELEKELKAPGVNEVGEAHE